MIRLQGHSRGSGQARYPHQLLEGGIISFPHGLLHHKTACFTQTFSGFKTKPERVQDIPFPGELPDPGIEPGSPALQANSSPAELLGKPASDAG